MWPGGYSDCEKSRGHARPGHPPYCITQALIRAVEGDVENGLIFCGDDAADLKEMTTVPEVVRGLLQSL